jgi:hypothetical protein
VGGGRGTTEPGGVGYIKSGLTRSSGVHPSFAYP